MGYRSEVTMLFYANNEEDFPMLKLWVDENLVPALREHWDYDPLDGNEYRPQEFSRGQSKGYALNFSDVKWYESYPDVQAIEEAWSKFDKTFSDEESASFGAERARIGEDYGDVEYDQTFHSMSLLNIVRHAEY